MNREKNIILRLTGRYSVLKTDNSLGRLNELMQHYYQGPPKCPFQILNSKSRLWRKKEEQEGQVSEEKQLEELMVVLEELKKEGKFVDIPICPRCKSARLKRVRSTAGDMWGKWR